MAANFLIKLALTAGTMALGALRRIEGPRVDDLKVTSGDYNAPWPRLWGMRWYRPPVIWAQDLREVKQTRKTKGGKFNDYTYFGSWAHGLACHELAAIRRIKADGHLVYDASGSGPVTPFSLTGDGSKNNPSGGAITDYMTFYPGDFTQLPDPAIAADVDARLGEGWTPAYRGRSYLVFKDLPLEKFGNRIPQIEVEAVSVVTPHYPFETRVTSYDPPNDMLGFTFSTDYSRLLWGDAALDQLEVWDIAARAPMIAAAPPVALAQQGGFGMRTDGRFYACGEQFPSLGQQKIWLIQPDLGGASEVLEVAGVDYQQSQVRVRADSTGAEHWLTIPYSNQTRFYADGSAARFLDLTGIDWAPAEWFADGAGSIWAVGRESGLGQTEAYFYRMITAPGATGPGFVTASGLPGTAVAFGRCTGAVAADGAFVLCWNGNALYRIDPADGTVLASRTGLSLEVAGHARAWSNLPPGSSAIWLAGGTSTTAGEYSLADLSTIRTVTYTDWTGAAVEDAIYDPINHALICVGSGSALTWRYLDRIGSEGVTLGDVVNDVAALAGIPLAEIDTSALSQIIPGYSVAGGTGKDWLEPLLDLFDVDARPHGFQLQFVPRGSAPDETVSSSNFAVNQDEPLFTATPETGATDLPQLVTMQFADLEIEQQPNSAMSPPLFEGDGRRNLSIDMASLALSPGDARQLVARFARRMRFDRKSYGHALPLSRIDLEPADVKVLDLAGVQITARLQSMVLDADRRMALEWKRDDPSVAVLDGAVGASADGHTTPVIAVPLLSRGFVLDIPLISDLHEAANPVIYVGAAPYGPGTWPGAALYRAVSGEYSDEVASIESGSAAIWGRASAALDDANPNLWDRLSVLPVTLNHGTLTGCTEADLDADPSRNLALIGQELVQFTSATLIAPNSWNLSGFKRGRRGTEWACAGHLAGDEFRMLGQMQVAARSLSDVGTSQSFKAVTNGRTEAGAFPIDLTPFTGAALKPYAPCHLTAAKDAGGGDWTLDWVRRSRIGAAWTGGAEIPLGEAAELYRVEIMDGAAIKRTISGLTTPTASYTDAQQVADWGVTQPSIAWRVRAISAAVGDGFAAVFV